jgi:glycerol-3-phosphate dehydrogenase
MSIELKQWSTKKRKEYIKELKETTYDVLIIGGVITGAGVLRECCLKGIKAALIEKDDFAFGTSSKSTRLAHGGVRYIVNLEFGLVSQETHERDWLRDAYPNVARPVPIIYANYSLIEAVVMALFFKVYDALAGFGNYRNSRHINKKEIEKLEPNLMIPGLHSGNLLYECIINDARLTLEVVKEGVILGGTAVNYIKANKIVTKENRAVGVEVVDCETDETYVISARNIVNATGPWTDFLMPKGNKPLIRPAKGIHIAVKRESIGNVSGLYVKSTVDKRGVFLLAHGNFTQITRNTSTSRGLLITASRMRSSRHRTFWGAMRGADLWLWSRGFQLIRPLGVNTSQR